MALFQQNQNSAQNLLWLSIHRNDATNLKASIDAGADIKAQLNGVYRSPLNHCAATGNKNLSKILVEHGAEIDSDFYCGNNVLHEAIRETHGDLALYFLTHCNADPKVLNGFGNTSLHLASLYGQTQVVYYLVNEVNMDPAERNGNGATSLDCAFAGGQTELIRYFIERSSHDLFPADAPKEVVNYRLALKFLQKAQTTVQMLSLANVNVLPVNHFIEAGRIPIFQECTENQWLVSAEELSETSRVLFLSHRWETDDAPDPNNTQYEVMVQFLAESELHFDYVWVDYSCITQDKSTELFTTHLSNIPTVLFFSTHCLVVPLMTDEHYSDLVDFLNRGWSQLETQVSMFTGCETFVSYKTPEAVAFPKLEPFKGFSLTGGFRLASDQSINHLQSELATPDTLWQLWGKIEEPILNMKKYVDAVIVFNNAHPDLMQKVKTMTIEESDIKGLKSSDNTFLRSLPSAFDCIGTFTSESDRLIVVRLLMFCIASGMHAYTT
mmetsp:Transcript_1368/g.1850  ORF Transcript_1368/g.1850 Transcript_1368/m.1850 type:complete len:496 (-) Transcript_1368:151-1638(-)